MRLKNQLIIGGHHPVGYFTNVFSTSMLVYPRVSAFYIPRFQVYHLLQQHLQLHGCHAWRRRSRGQACDATGRGGEAQSRRIQDERREVQVHGTWKPRWLWIKTMIKLLVLNLGLLDGWLGVTGMILTSDCGSFPHCLLSTSKLKSKVNTPQYGKGGMLYPKDGDSFVPYVFGRFWMKPLRFPMKTAHIARPSRSQEWAEG